MSDLAERLVRVLVDHRPVLTGDDGWLIMCGCGFQDRDLSTQFTHPADAVAAEVGRALEGTREVVYDALCTAEQAHAENYRPEHGATYALATQRAALGLTTTPASLAGRDEETK